MRQVNSIEEQVMVRRTEQEQQFEDLCSAVDADEMHEQEAIDFFEQCREGDEFDASVWLDIALYHSTAVARGIIDLVAEDDKLHCTIGEAIAETLDIAYSPDECRLFAESLQLAISNGVPVDLDAVLDACQALLDEMSQWAADEDRAPVLILRDELIRLKDEFESGDL
jgi:hypothetical protein